ncbi:MAG: folA [Actinomycetia bacterium]|nr:folA [Actinomycetes bacterium]
MGRVVLWMQQTVDGYVEGPNGEFDWPLVEDELHTHFNEVIERTASAFLYGRKVFEMMAGFWPTATEVEHANTARFARLWVPMPKYVFSNTLETAAWSSQVVSGDLTLGVKQIKAEHDGDLLLIGGATIAGELTRLGLIDEYHVFTHPVLLGGGTRLHPQLEQRINLELVETRTFEPGVVLHRYLPR